MFGVVLKRKRFLTIGGTKKYPGRAFDVGLEVGLDFIHVEREEKRVGGGWRRGILG